jgi:hypothetical protein
MIKSSYPAWLGFSSRDLYQLQEWLFILAANDNPSRPLLDRLESEYAFIKTT